MGLQVEAGAPPMHPTNASAHLPIGAPSVPEGRSRNLARAGVSFGLDCYEALCLVGITTHGVSSLELALVG